MAFWKRKEQDPTESREEKKLGLFKKIRGIDWKNPVNRWKLLIVSFFVVIVGLGFVGGAIAVTNNPAFCSVCHEMAPEHVTFTESAHNQVTCVSCHIEPGNVNMVLHKIESLKEVYYHIVGPPDPIIQTVAVLDENCKQCHSDNREVSAKGDLVIAHNKHVDEEIPCITCHSGVAHAKVVERGINDSTMYDDWKIENANKLMGKENMSPNMGTCIDCHNQVNEGKKPWKDIAYSLPENTHKVKAASINKKDLEAKKENRVVYENEIQISKQEMILQTINKQKDSKLSNDCSTCHKKINTPKNHDSKIWNENHGQDALKELDSCLNCHKDSKWIKVLAKQNIKDLLNGSTIKDEYKENMVVVKEEARNNQFCNSCHQNRPPSHADKSDWLTGGHVWNSLTSEGKDNCFVCHDNEKPKTKEAPSDIYCESCHRTGFKSDQL